MKRVFYFSCVALLSASTIVSCKKNASVETAQDPSALTQEEKALVKNAGFNSNWANKTDGGFLIEGDILMSKEQLQEMAGKSNTNNFFVTGFEEHYRTTNLVNTNGGVRTISVRLGAGFPSYYSTGLNSALARYNALNLNIRFSRVTTGGEIVISAANLGTTANGGCVLGRASGFPSGGNPSSGFTLSNSQCATSFLSTASAADEVIAHEIGHCIGFRHTDYATRSSCGQNTNEGSAGIGAIYIPGTPTSAQTTSTNGSWMMACTNGNPNFTAQDNTALNFVY